MYLVEKRFERCFMLHHVMGATKDLLKNVILIQVCDTIMQGKAENIK